MAAPQFLNAPIILLKEGTDVSQGRPQIISNINACQAIVDMVRTTLGPRGMDKLIHEEGNQNVTITNDGATVVDLLNVVHPAAKTLVDIAKTQDDEVGDGTTSVVLLAGELLSEAKAFIEEGVAPQNVIHGYQRACELAVHKIRDLQVCLPNKSDKDRRQALIQCAQTSLNSKLVAGYKGIFAKMVVDAVLMLDASLDKTLIGIKKVTGGSVTDSILVDGVAFKKTFSYAGFEQQPKRIENPKVLLLNVELELKAEKENAEVRIDNPERRTGALDEHKKRLGIDVRRYHASALTLACQDYQSIVDAEWKIIFNKLDRIVDTGAQVVLSRLPIGDLATQYFADRNIFCAGRVEDADLRRTARATGAQIQTSVNNMEKTVLGTCGLFEEMQIGSERYNLFKQCRLAKTATIILRGGAQQFTDEAERSLNDAIMIVRRALKTNAVVGGGGAIEMELSRELRDYSRTITGKQQLVISAFAKALECIPRTLASNAGLEQVDILNQLRQAHYQNKPETRWIGVDCVAGGTCDTFNKYIWEPALVKIHALQAATEAACSILSIDETVCNAKSNAEPMPQMPAMAGRGRGMRQLGGRM